MSARIYLSLGACVLFFASCAWAQRFGGGLGFRAPSFRGPSFPTQGFRRSSNFGRQTPFRPVPMPRNSFFNGGRPFRFPPQGRPFLHLPQRGNFGSSPFAPRFHSSHGSFLPFGPGFRSPHVHSTPANPVFHHSRVGFTSFGFAFSPFPFGFTPFDFFFFSGHRFAFSFFFSPFFGFSPFFFRPFVFSPFFFQPFLTFAPYPAYPGCYGGYYPSYSSPLNDYNAYDYAPSDYSPTEAAPERTDPAGTVVNPEDDASSPERLQQVNMARTLDGQGQTFARAGDDWVISSGHHTLRISATSPKPAPRNLR